MTSPDVETYLSTAATETVSPPKTAVDDVVEAVVKVSLQDETAADSNQKINESPPRPLHVYSRYGLIHLSKSPLVGVPEGMPVLKDWFGCVRLLSGPVSGNDNSAQRLE